MLSNAIAVFADATSDHDRLLRVITESVGEATRSACNLLLLDDDDQAIRAASSYVPLESQRATMAEFLATPIRRDELSLVWKVLASGAPLHVPHIDREFYDRTTPRGQGLLRGLDVKSMIIIALRARGTSLGVIVLLRGGDGPPLDALDVELAQDFANHAALAITNARLVAALRATQELARAQAEALRANRLLDAIVENIPSMIFVKDAVDLAFVRFNKAGEELLGAPREALIGKTDHDFFPPSEAEFFQAKDRETLANKQLVDIPEEPIQTARGERWLHTKKVPIVDEHGSATHLLGISYDITERRLADARLRAAKERAEVANAELESFSYSVAHDLRAPLRAIDGFSMVLFEDHAERLDDAGKRALQRIRDAAQRMATLIDDLLALSRVTRAGLTRMPIDLADLATGAIERLRRSDLARNVEVVIQPGLVVDADPRLMTVVFDNLVGNAWKFTSRTARARIEIARAEPAGYVVRDNGAGFAMEFAHKLFGVFQRLHHESEFPGTGIGLATVARIIRRHHGRVWAEGAPDRGASFYFTIGEAEAE